MPKARALDFTDVKDGGGRFRKTHYPAGDYKAKILKVEDAKKKSDNSPMWLVSIAVKAGIYPYYLTFESNTLWKIRNLFIAAGLPVPKKRVKVDPQKLVGKVIGVTLDEEEYEGKMQGVIASTFPSSELEGGGDDDDVEEDNSSDEDEEDEDEEEEKSDDSDDEEEEDEEPAPKPKKKKKKDKGKKAASDDDSLEELDIEDV